MSAKSEVTVVALLERAGAFAEQFPAEDWRAFAEKHGADVAGAWRAAEDPAVLVLLAYGATVDPRRILRACARVIEAIAGKLPAGVEAPPLEALSIVHAWDDEQVDSAEASRQIAEACARVREVRLAPIANAVNAAIFQLLDAMAGAAQLVGRRGPQESSMRERAAAMLPEALALAALGLTRAITFIGTDGTQPTQPQHDEGGRWACALLRDQLAFELVERGLAGALPHPVGPYAFAPA